jgi:hypothetical protein
MAAMICEYVDETTIHYIIVLSVFLIFLYVLYATYSTQMNVIEGLTANNGKRCKREGN